MILLLFLIAGAFDAPGQKGTQEYSGACNEVFKCMRPKNCKRFDCSIGFRFSGWDNGARPEFDSTRSVYYRDVPVGMPKDDSIVFSPSEVKYVSNAIHTWAFSNWEVGGKFDSVSFFTNKFVDSIIATDNAIGHIGPHGDFYYRVFPCGVSEVSHPVFLRDSTLCIVYQSILGESENMSIYKKIKRRWAVYCELMRTIID